MTLRNIELSPFSRHGHFGVKARLGWLSAKTTHTNPVLRI